MAKELKDIGQREVVAGQREVVFEWVTDPLPSAARPAPSPAAHHAFSKMRCRPTRDSCLPFSATTFSSHAKLTDERHSSVLAAARTRTGQLPPVQVLTSNGSPFI